MLMTVIIFISVYVTVIIETCMLLNYPGKKLHGVQNFFPPKNVLFYWNKIFSCIPVCRQFVKYNSLI